MPALRMKNKPSSTSLKETDVLCVCQKSYMITKKSFSDNEFIEERFNSYNCSQHSCTEGDFEDLRHKETKSSCQLLNVNNTEIDQQLWFAVDSTSSEELENGSSSRHDMTTFSPVASPNEISGENISSCPSFPIRPDNGMEGSLFDLLQSMTDFTINSFFSIIAGSTCQLSMPALETDEIYWNKNSYDYQTYSISDFYISDVIIASIPPNGDAVSKESDDNDDDDANEMKSVDYWCNESGLLIDVADHFMIVPFVGSALIAKDDGIAKSDDADNSGKESSSFYLSVDEIIARTSESQCNSEVDTECFDPQLFIRTLPDLSDEVTSSQSDPLQSNEEKRKSVTLVLDLDETLVHSTLDHQDDADFTFTVFFNMAEHVVSVKKRPHLQNFLERVADMFTVVIFTASQSIYACQLLDILDPNQQLISHRVYRESCTFSDGTYTKDLTILGVDLAKVAIIDNSPQVFGLQVNNGIPIKSWFDDPSDCALMSLLPFLETLVEVDDVRPIIARRFGNQE